MSIESTTIADLYLRLSDLRADDLYEDDQSKGLVEHERQLRERAARLHWTVGEVIIENDMRGGRPQPASAYKRRKVRLPDGTTALRVIRPGFRRLIKRIRTNKSNAVLTVDLDRVVRDPRDLEDLIDVVQERRANVQSITGSLRFTDGGDDAEITLARVMVTMANKSSRDTARRVSAARLRQALHGEFGGGTRPFGFCLGPPKLPQGSTSDEHPCPWHGGRACKAGITPIASETSIVVDCTERALQGVSFKLMAAELRRKGVPTVTGASWSAGTLREILLRPRNAGLVVYRKKIVEGVVAPWKPIVPRHVFDALQLKLTHPARHTGPGPAPKWEGSGLYRCGICTPPGSSTERPVTCQVKEQTRKPRYRCKAHAHLTRDVGQVDRWIHAHILYALTHPRAYELLMPATPDVDVKTLSTERAAIVERLKSYARDEILGRRTPEQVTEATLVGRQRITEIDGALSASVTGDPMADVLNAPDPVAAWAAAPLANRRLIIDRVCTVTILPTTRRGRGGFDPTAVLVEPKHGLGAPPQLAPA
ncbi:recombinase family protein [Actinoplanes sp. NBRC 103695]|uniref:recombinase family protein n=1 Tax=Actinoplanes sp. NBRC 103695 TaxID=3032202 RepID=UPI0024A03915|nr:recombinase family protein [Actinoplanes sp. NBRC 103695]GLZ01711.1 serine recombinase [Actinoplanes sp. NBRC 103695]